MFRCAIIGCGRIAGRYDRSVPTHWSLTHAGAYHLCPATKLVAVADPHPGTLKAFQEKWHIGRGYTDYGEMLENETIDILSLCLPTEYHFVAFKAAVDHNIRAIFCEKPLSYDLDEAHRMVEMSQGRVVSVNYFRRWNPTIAEIAQCLKGGDFGKGINATIRYTKGLFLNGSHLVDLMRWFWVEPRDVNLIRIVQDNPIDPGVDFSLTFADDIAAYCINIPEVDYVFVDVDILMEKGRIVIGQRGQTLEKYSVAQEPHHQLFNVLGDSEKLQTGWRNCTMRAVQEIADCLENGGKTSCTVEDGYRALEICHQILGLRK